MLHENLFRCIRLNFSTIYLKRFKRSFYYSAFNMEMFTQKRNAITGDTQWDVHHEQYDFHQEIARSAFGDMLHDTERNKKYYRALQLAIDKMHENGKMANVLDIGTGTGLLSMMAVKCGADTVVACEAFKPMAACAEKILHANGFADKIKLIQKRSTDLTVGDDGDMKQKANILVTEVFDTELIGEGALPTFIHAHECLLEKDCIVIPDSAVLYAQVVECPTLRKWNKLNDLVDEDLKLILKTPQRMKTCAGSAAIHDVQLSQLSRQAFTELSEQVPAFYFDLSGATPLHKKRFVKQQIEVTATGSAQMVFMWWELNMDCEGKICLSCAPWWCHPDVDASAEYPQDTIPWRDHWMQGVYYLPQECILQKGQEVTLLCCHDEYSLWFYLEDAKTKNTSCLRPICECGVHMAFSRTHVSYLNDGRRSKNILSILEEKVNDKSVVLDLNGSSLKGLAAAALKPKMVYILESMKLNLDILDEFAKGNSIENVKYVSEATEDILNQVTHVISDPIFSNAILPWENLKIANLLLKYRKHLNDNVEIVPEKCKLYVMPVQFLDLHKIRIPLGVCEGFDMSIFDTLVEDSRVISDQELEAQPLWEYPCICRGPPEEILTVDFYQLEEKYAKDGKFPILIPESQTNAVVNAFAVWCDWKIGSRTFSTGPISDPEFGRRVSWDTHTRQAVKLLKQEIILSEDNTWCFQLACDLKEGAFNLKLDIV